MGLLSALALACSSGEGDAPGAPADPAPEFTLEQIGGGQVSLASLRGKTVIIDFWATWCPPCEFQVPELNAFYEEHAGSGHFEVLGISVDTDPVEVVEEWIAERGVTYPILMGDEDLARRYGAIGFPTLVIVDPEGEVRARHVGLVERAELEEAIAAHRAGT